MSEWNRSQYQIEPWFRVNWFLRRERRSIMFLEQAVYGSFPFWDRGYAILAHSPGCRPEWLQDIKTACQRFGERPPGALEFRSMFVIRLPGGPWAIVEAQPQGADDRGRPGALAFHAILVSRKDYARSGNDPFVFVGCFRRDWSAEVKSLPTISWEPSQPTPQTDDSPLDPRVPLMVRALKCRNRVAIQSVEPLDTLARSVWSRLPARLRGRLSLATWAFGNANQFDFVAVPRLAAVVLDHSYLDPSIFEPGAALDVVRPTPAWLRIIHRGWSIAARHPRIVKVSLIIVAIGILLNEAIQYSYHDAPPDSTSPPVVHSGRFPGVPDRGAYSDEPLSERDEREVRETLTDLCEKLKLLEPGEAETLDIRDLLRRLATRVRYQGGFLTADLVDPLLESSRTGSRLSSESARILEWHQRILLFKNDRPLPDDFSEGPLRRAFDVVLWSFHNDPDPSRTPVQAASALADLFHHNLSLRVPVHLAEDRALRDYAAFLGRLPRR